MAAITSQIELLDSHIHLFAHKHLKTLNWTEGLPESHPLNRQRSVDDYRRATNESRVIGFIFVETDRKYDIRTSDWTHPLREVEFFVRIASGDAGNDEGFKPRDKELALAMVPWAPMCEGARVLEEYVSLVKRACINHKYMSLIKGFRFLLQNQPQGTMLTAQFIQSLEWLHVHDYSFDLTIDCHSTGLWQIQESIELLKLLQARQKLPTVILDHCGKPNLCMTADSAPQTEAFRIWEQGMKELAEFPNVYVKLSGLISEMSSGSIADMNPSDLSKHISPWADVLKRSFGPARIMFGSDWPVCTVNGPDSHSWRLWYDTIAAVLDTWNCSDVERSAVWAGTARKAYRLGVVSPESRL